MNRDDEDRLNEEIRELATEYHAPPETPRDRMWAAIEARRRTPSPTAVRPFLRPARRWRPYAWAAGIAAVLLLGIGLGRMSIAPAGVSAPVPQTIAAAPVPSHPPVALEQAATQHLARVEAFLTSFRVGGSPDDGLTAQARDLLTSTRLLLDSRAVEDPRLHLLLEDLELILVQIVQLGGPEDFNHVTDGLEQRQVMPRLRIAIPAGPGPTTGVS